MVDSARIALRAALLGQQLFLFIKTPVILLWLTQRASERDATPEQRQAFCFMTSDIGISEILIETLNKGVYL